MRSQSALRTSNTWRVGLMLLAVSVVSITGMFGLNYPSPYSLLIAEAAAAAAITVIAFLWKPVWALYAALFVVLLPIGLIPPQIHSDLNRLMTIVALATWLFDTVTRRRRVVWTSTALLMLGFITWGIVTLFWAANPRIATNALQTYALRLILFLVLIANEIRTKPDLDGLMKTLAFNGWVLVLVGAGTLLSGGYITGTRFQVLDMNENQTGILALLTLPGVLWQARWTSGRNRTARMFLSFTFISLALVLAALSGSRGSAISFLISLLAFWLWKPTRLWGRLGLLILVLAAVSIPLLFSTTLERFAVERGDTLLGGREAIWQAARYLIRDHLWGGVGIGNAPYEVMPYLRILRNVGGYEWSAIHNPVLAIFAETGIMGILLYLAVLGSAVWSFARQYYRHRKAGVQEMMPYYALISSVFLGYLASWIKGGGMEYNFSYFLMLALLLIPSQLDLKTWSAKQKDMRKTTASAKHERLGTGEND